MAEKYDFIERQYKPYVLPKSSAMVRENMDDIISCANCGISVRYGECYTSLTIHNLYGIGYCICGQCHSVELVDAAQHLRG